MIDLLPSSGSTATTDASNQPADAGVTPAGRSSVDDWAPVESDSHHPTGEEIGWPGMGEACA